MWRFRSNAGMGRHRAQSGLYCCLNPEGLQRPRIPWLPQSAKMQLVPPAQESREINLAVECQPCTCRNLSLLQVKGLFSTPSSHLQMPSDTVRRSANHYLAGKQQTQWTDGYGSTRWLKEMQQRHFPSMLYPAYSHSLRQWATFHRDEILKPEGTGLII